MTDDEIQTLLKNYARHTECYGYTQWASDAYDAIRTLRERLAQVEDHYLHLYHPEFGPKLEREGTIGAILQNDRQLAKIWRDETEKCKSENDSLRRQLQDHKDMLENVLKSLEIFVVHGNAHVTARVDGLNRLIVQEGSLIDRARKMIGK